MDDQRRYMISVDRDAPADARSRTEEGQLMDERHNESLAEMAERLKAEDAEERHSRASWWSFRAALGIVIATFGLIEQIWWVVLFGLVFIVAGNVQAFRELGREARQTKARWIAASFAVSALGLGLAVLLAILFESVSIWVPVLIAVALALAAPLVADAVSGIGDKG